MRATVLTLALFAGSCIAWAGSICPTSSGPTGFAHNPDNANTGCNIVITINSNGSTSVSVRDSTPYDPANPNSEDTLVGVVNNSTSPVSTLQLTGSNLFNFDQDGICSFSFTGNGYCLTNAPGGTSSTGVLGTESGVDPYDYQGPTTSFSNISAGGGTVHFSPALGTGGASTYFSLEGVPSGSLLQVGPPATPIPSSMLLAMVGFAVLLAYFYLGKRFSSAH